MGSRARSPSGWSAVDEAASFVRLPKFLRYNGPENLNQVCGWNAVADLIHECAGKIKLLADACAIKNRREGSGLGDPFTSSPQRL